MIPSATYENPYKTGDFREPVDVRRDAKTQVSRNIFHSSKPLDLCWTLWNCSWGQREQQWAQQCIISYAALPALPTPVSPSEMGRRWGCSHTWARKLILGSWDWIGISDRHYIHSSWVAERGWVWRACLESTNPLSCINAVNLLRDYAPAPDDPLPASERSLTTWLGMSKLQRLREAGIIRATLPLRSRHKMYYVPQKRSETRIVAAVRAEQTR